MVPDQQTQQLGGENMLQRLGYFDQFPSLGQCHHQCDYARFYKVLLQADVSVGMLIHLCNKYLSAPSQNYNWITLLIGSNQAIFTLSVCMPSHSLLPYSPAPFGGKPFSPPPLSERGSQ